MPDESILYTIVVAGKPKGPYTMAELKELALTPDTFVRKPGMDDYKEAHEIEEIRELMGFAVPKNAPQYFAAFDQRLMAWAIDYFLITTVYAILLFIALLWVEEAALRIIMILIATSLILCTKFFYSVYADATEQQGTIGKKLLAIKIADVNGEKISLQKSLVRNLSKALSVMIFFMGYVYMLFNKRSQCLHDVIADTLVMKDRLL